MARFGSYGAEGYGVVRRSSGSAVVECYGEFSFGSVSRGSCGMAYVGVYRNGSLGQLWIGSDRCD